MIDATTREARTRADDGRARAPSTSRLRLGLILGGAAIATLATGWWAVRASDGAPARRMAATTDAAPADRPPSVPHAPPSVPGAHQPAAPEAAAVDDRTTAEAPASRADDRRAFEQEHLAQVVASGPRHDGWTRDVRDQIATWTGAVPRELSQVARFGELACYVDGCVLPVRYSTWSQMTAFDRALLGAGVIGGTGVVHRFSATKEPDGTVASTFLFMAP